MYLVSWFHRLKMNIKTLKQLLLKKDPPMCDGRQQWQWDSKQVYHGSCASKEMLLILWLVHCYLESNISVNINWTFGVLLQT